MKHITVVIPTRNRIEKLEKTLASIPESSFISVAIVCDGDKKSYDHLRNLKRKYNIYHVTNHKGSVFCRNLAIREVLDGVLYATDDIIFQNNSIQLALDLLNKTFPDDDGVVGFKQNTNKYCPTGVALVGKKFLSRFIGKELFYPQYWHFCAQEIDRLCQKISKNVFVSDDKIAITHRHPSFNKKEMDQTHLDARKHRQLDRDLSMQRQKQDIVWGNYE